MDILFLTVEDGNRDVANAGARPTVSCPRSAQQGTTLSLEVVMADGLAPAFQRIVEADNASVIKAYEGKIAKLESERRCCCPKEIFESCRRRAG